MGGFTPKPLRPKSVQQPKVQSQMSAPKPVTTPAGPTTTEAAYDKTKRRGRKATLLTSSKGATDEVELQLKTLLGG